MKELIKKSPFYPLIYPITNKIICYHKKGLFPKEHRQLHNENNLFYTLSPALLIAIQKAFRMQSRSLLTGDFGYYEFGLFKGFSFWYAEQLSREYTESGFHHYGFDSFEGMPAPIVDKGLPQWSRGTYSASLESVEVFLKQNKADFSRIQLFKGFYSPKYFKQLEAKKHFRQASICVIDSDLYESCVAVLDFIGKYFVPGTIILFDDWNTQFEDDNHGERRALFEYEQGHPLFHKEKLFDFGSHGIAFKVGG